MPDIDPYAVLGVSALSSVTEIKKAYRKRQRETHPDVGGSNEDFRRVEDAWAILGNKFKRAEYDGRSSFTPYVARPRTAGNPYSPQSHVWSDEDERIRQMYQEQADWFVEAKLRREKYAASVADEEIFPKPSSVNEGLRSRTLWLVILGLVIIGISSSLIFASSPEILSLIRLPLIVSDVVLIFSSVVVSILIAVRSNEARPVRRLVAKIGIIATIVLTAVIVSLAAVSAVVTVILSTN